MQNGFLAQEIGRAGNVAKRFFMVFWVVAVIALAVLFVVSRFEEEVAGYFPMILICSLVVMLLLSIAMFLKDRRAKQQLADHSYMILDYDDVSKKEAGRIIDEEAAQGKILVSEYINDDSKAEKIVLLPSYLLFFDMYKVKVIPVHKIFWVCAQVGYKGGPFIVRVKVFAENKMYEMEGGGVDYTINIVDKIYRHLPNIFYDYDAFDLSYKLEEAFTEDYEQFVAFCEEHRQDYLNKSKQEE